MQTNRHLGLGIRLVVALGAALVLAMTSVQTTEAAPMTGAVHTTDSTCTGVNLNHYDSKLDVYLEGGPARVGSAGLPAGQYYVKITTPNGTLLGTSIGAADVTPVLVNANGEFAVCYQLWDILVRASNGAKGYDDTTNPGGEYKVWVCQTSAFDNSTCKTDNFKVDLEEPGTSPLDACAPFPNRIIITFDDFVLRRDQADRIQTPAEAVTIAPGTYNVTLQSFDNHLAKPNQFQFEEQWFLRFTLAGGGTVTSATISDLPEEPITTLNESVGQIVFGSTATSVVAVHKLPFLGTQGTVAQSVVPRCAALDPVTT